MRGLARATVAAALATGGLLVTPGAATAAEIPPPCKLAKYGNAVVYDCGTVVTEYTFGGSVDANGAVQGNAYTCFSGGLCYNNGFVIGASRSGVGGFVFSDLGAGVSIVSAGASTSLAQPCAGVTVIYRGNFERPLVDEGVCL